MIGLDGVTVDVTVVLGSAEVPIRQMLQVSRGVTIPLNGGADSAPVILVAGKAVATGTVLVRGDAIAIEIASLDPADFDPFGA